MTTRIPATARSCRTICPVILVVAASAAVPVHDPPPADSARTLPLWMGWSPALDARLEVELPKGYAVAPRQMPPAVQGPIGDYGVSAVEKDGRLVLERHLTIHEDYVPAARWSEAQQLLHAIYRGDNSPILLKPAGSAK